MALWNQLLPKFYLALAAAVILGQFTATVLAADTLERRDIKDARQRRAVCNDFSDAVYFMWQGSPNHWIVYFEGGGGCSSFSDCNQRYKNFPVLMGSLESTPSIIGEDILSSDRNVNSQFYNYTHVLVPYCSSDAWLGNKTNQRFDDMMSFVFDDSENADNFVYTGQLILRAVIEDLYSLGLKDATDLILVGSSAGGIGLLNNIDWINGMVSVNNTRVIIDSAWFVSYTGYHVLQFNEQVAQTLNFAPACHDVSLGYPCCASPFCLFSRGYLDNVNVPILAISSLYDIFTLEHALRDSIQQHGQDVQAILALFNGYSSVVNESLSQSYSTYPQLSVYAPSCSQHVYFAPSSLWYPDGELSNTSPGEYQEALFRLTNPIAAGNWERVKVTTHGSRSVTLLQAVEQWANDSTMQFFITDTCSGPACSICPSKISVTPEKNLWSPQLNLIVLTLSALMTIAAVSIKLSAYCYMKYLLYQQNVFSFERTSGKRRNFPKPTHAVNIACTELSYHIWDRRMIKMDQQREDTTDDAQPCSAQNYPTHAKLEMFVPCYKKLCSKWYTRWSSNKPSPSQLHVNSHCSQSELGQFRPDSRISSASTKIETKSNSEFDTPAFNILANDKGPPTGRHRKAILNQVNMYINPGELVAIMGPSGSGKTTLLDVLLNKRTSGITKGQIFINGAPLSKMRHWFVRNTGYVRQLATYYYNELTVRENLLFSMNMQAMRGMSVKQKLGRIEQVIREMGLQEQADVVVGDTVNGGLSGGQRKRLAIAVQLLSAPNILFLDEPTSGLDSASSLEILKSLSMLAETGRAVVVTIHQPRSEIFHSFDKILLLCNGQVAFFGSPIKVWDFFTDALDYEDESLSDAGSSINTADRILDLLKERNKQQQVLLKYRGCGEPAKVKYAVERGRESRESTPLPLDSRDPGFWHRLVSLEARASLRQTLFSTLYLPIVYLFFGAILGTTYLYTDTPVQVMSVTCLLSCSSSLFMSSIIMSLLIEPLKLFQLEHSDGISNAHELVIQVFIRMSTLCTLPLSVCSTMVFILVYQNYNIEVYFIVLLTFLLVNQCWLALFILFTVLYPPQAHRLCPVFSAIGGFCCGFIVPKPLMPVYYRWIFYINPSFYAYAGTTVTVLTDNDLGCSRDSPLECFRESSVATLAAFGLEDVNPIENMVVLMAMVWVLLVLAVTVLQVKVTYPMIKEKLEPLFCFLLKGKKRQQQVHSSNTLGVVENHHHTCMLHSTVNPGPSTSGQPPAYSVVDLEAVDAKINSQVSVCGCVCQPVSSEDKELAVSTEFLPDGKHTVVFDFPWERHQPVVDETEFNAPPTTHAVVQPHQQPLETGGTQYVSSTAHRGEEMRTSTRKNDTIVQITMEDVEGIDEVERRKIANEKWKQRRAQMDTELKRLKHSQRNKERARRRSGSFIHDALQDSPDLMQQRRKVSSSAHGTRTRSPSITGRRSTRTMSMQVGRSEAGNLLGFQNPLRPHDEVMDEDDAGFGLPPKDIPFFEENPTVSALDMSQIPVEEIRAMQLEHSTNWNTVGGQDGPF